MTSSSGPGISLKQEGISYLAADELPAVIVNMMRGGPGMGNISAAQSDYFQATRGGGHGDYKTVVLAPGLGAGAHRGGAGWPSTWPTSTATPWSSWATACSGR